MALQSDFTIENGVLKKYRGEAAAVTIPEGIREIGFCAFMWCTTLEELIIPEGVELIGHEAFYGCRSLRMVTLPGSLKAMEALAFSGCSALESVSFPDALISVGKGAFSDCTSLRSVAIPGGGSTALGPGVFSRCPSLSDDEGLTIINGHLYGYFGNDEEVSIPDGVRIIEDSAFRGCSNVRKVALPSTIESVSPLAFTGCQGLSDSDGYVIVWGILFNYYGFGRNLALPEGVKIIAPGAFSGCREIIRVTLPESLEAVDSEAFSDCTDLREVVLKDSVKSIGAKAFFGCRKLEAITFPEETEIIGTRALGGCTTLRRIIIKGTPVLEPDWLPGEREVILSCRLPISAFSPEAAKHKAAIGYLFRAPVDPEITPEAEDSIRAYISGQIHKFLDEAHTRRALLPALAEKKLIPLDRVEKLVSDFAGDTVNVGLLLNYAYRAKNGYRKAPRQKVRKTPSFLISAEDEIENREINVSFSEKDTPQELAEKIFQLSKGTLLVNLRYLDEALGKLKLYEFADTTVSTEGTHILYSPEYIVRSFKADRSSITGAHLHLLLHCIFGHVFQGANLNRPVWDLSCDIAVENAVTELNLPQLRNELTEEKRSYCRLLSMELPSMTAGAIYRHFQDTQPKGEEFSRLKCLFAADDHTPWYWTEAERRRNLGLPELQEPSEKKSKNEMAMKSTRSRQWQDISQKIETTLEASSEEKRRKSGSVLQNLSALSREKYSYADFLRKFAVNGEILKADDNEFDYIYYTYGLSLYKNLPLIEPLEYRSTKQIREFVVAIDTSASTSGALVQKFIQKTYNLLLSTESFFSKINLHIFQCNSEIQEHTKISSRKEFDAYIRSMKIHGSGTTDFRPVFDKVDELVKQGEFKDLRGLIYFTDGRGTYPLHKPQYQTAFVFVDDGFSNPSVPSWAIKLILQDDDPTDQFEE